MDELLSVLKDEFSVRTKNPADFVGKTNVLPIRDNQNSVKIDLIFSFIDYERKAIERAETVLSDDESIQIVAASDLIIYKLIADRTRDIEDAKSILERKSGEVNVEFIDKHLLEMSDLLGRGDIYKNWNILKKEVF